MPHWVGLTAHNGIVAVGTAARGPHFRHSIQMKACAVLTWHARTWIFREDMRHACGGVNLLDTRAHGVHKAAGRQCARRLAEGGPALADLAIGHAGQWDQRILLKLLLQALARMNLDRNHAAMLK